MYYQQTTYTPYTIDDPDAVWRLNSLRKRLEAELFAVDQALAEAQNTLPTIQVEE